MKATVEELYQAHLATLFGVKTIEEFSDRDVGNAFDTLLQILPNDGKLYKYRSIKSDLFEDYWEALQDGYLWFPKAEELNDDLDTVLYFDPEIEAINMRNLVLSKPLLFFKSIMDNSDVPIQIGYDQFDQTAFRKVMNCCDLKKGELSRDKAIQQLSKMGIGFLKAQHFIHQVENFAEEFIKQHENILESVISAFITINTRIRKMTYIYSMSETYMSNPMWALYANNNHGFCIEYDFRKAKSFSVAQKKLLLTFLRVNYSDEKREYSFHDMLRYILTGKKDADLYLRSNSEMFFQLLTKEADWAFEKEWRIMLTNLENNKVFLNLVSSIIIDERVLKATDPKEKDRAKRLIKLCKEKEWPILVRKTRHVKVAHWFEELREEDL